MNSRIPVLIDPDSIESGKTDNRGRINLGTDYADQNVRVAVLDMDGYRLAEPDPGRATCPNACGPLVVTEDGENLRIACPECGYDGGSPE